MSLVQANNIQPASGQALTIKDEGGSASITVATNGEATFAENIIVGTNGKGISFVNQTPTSASYATTSAELFSHYEEGQWTPDVTSGTMGGSGSGYNSAVGTYTRIGRMCFLQGSFRIANSSGASGGYNVAGLPFSIGGAGSNPLATTGAGVETNITGASLQVFTISATQIQIRNYAHSLLTNTNAWHSFFIYYYI